MYPTPKKSLSNKAMSFREQIEKIEDDWNDKKITYDQLVERFTKVQAECLHENKRTYTNEDDFYVWCDDCKEDL